MQNVDPWMKNMVEGCYYDALAWHLRGSGYADSVTKEGWNGFRDNIEKAADHFTKAWELDPAVPYAAAHMIDVANSGAAGDLSPRDWFDRSVQVRMDFEPAYSYYTHHLLPQWSGSHQKMYVFGRECLKTKRFDTCVPFQLIIILARINEQMGAERQHLRHAGRLRRGEDGLGTSRKEPPAYTGTLLAADHAAVGAHAARGCRRPGGKL